MSIPESQQVALVTGASRGIGRAIALDLAASGRLVIVNSLSRREAAEAVCEEIRAAGGRAEPCLFDVADAAACSAAAEALLARHSHIDIFINNAGTRKDALLVWTEPADWLRILMTNTGGFFHLAPTLVKAMIPRRFGRIVSIVSASAQMGVPGQCSYSASKAAVAAASRCLALEVATKGITVNCVSPGFIDTDMIADLPMDEIKQRIPMKRVGQPAEVASLVRHLCSAGAAYTTGQLIAVNGGIC